MLSMKKLIIIVILSIFSLNGSIKKKTRRYCLRKYIETYVALSEACQDLDWVKMKRLMSEVDILESLGRKYGILEEMEKINDQCLRQIFENTESEMSQLEVEERFHESQRRIQECFTNYLPKKK